MGDETSEWAREEREAWDRHAAAGPAYGCQTCDAMSAEDRARWGIPEEHVERSARDAADRADALLAERRKRFAPTPPGRARVWGDPPAHMPNDTMQVVGGGVGR